MIARRDARKLTPTHWIALASILVTFTLGMLTYFDGEPVPPSSGTTVNQGPSSGSGTNIGQARDVIIHGDPALYDKYIESLEEDKRDLLTDNEALKAQLEDALKELAYQTSIDNASSRIAEAEQELERGNSTLAEAIYQEVAERKIQEGEYARKEAAVALRRLGALAYLQDTGKSLMAYQRALEFDPDHLETLNQLGHLYQRTGELTKSESAYQRILDLAGNDQLVVAAASGNLGIVYLTRGDLDAAEAMYNKALAIDEELGSKESMANQYGNLGNVYMTRGDLDEAEAMYNKALAIDEKLGRKGNMARQYGNLGVVYRTRGDLDAAEAMHNKALAIDEELGSKEGMANQHSNLGNVYLTRGDLDEAEAMYNKALAINEELDRKEGVAIQYGNLGIVYKTRGDLDAARQSWEAAVQLFDTIGSPNANRAREWLSDLD